MMNEFAEGALWTTLIISTLSLLQPLLMHRLPLLMQWRTQQLITLTLFTLITFAFVGLISAHISSDFSLHNVAENSHSKLSLFYRIAAVWGNHEGSLLLWLWILSLYGAVVALKGYSSQIKLQSLSLCWHSVLMLLVTGYLLMTSNPFAHAQQWLTEGKELNPLLHDPALAIHPPILYMGYAGFAIPFCYALAMTFTNTKSIILYSMASIRRWLLWSWSFLTLGITLGSLWAYYELGWGGWWFWDPVENASLLPWLTATAALHTLHVTRQSKNFIRTTWSLVVSSFILCLLGTFLVRSGVLSTVHAFAYDAERGRWLLWLMITVTVISFVAGIRIQQQYQNQRHIDMGLNRATLLSIMGYLMVVMMLTVLVGTLYPLLLRAMGGAEISIGVPYFEKTFIPIGLVVVFMMSLAPFVPWVNQSRALLFKIHWGLLLLLLGCTGLLSFNSVKLLAGLALILGTWAIIMTIAPLWTMPYSARWSYVRSGMLWAHVGCGCMLIGMATDTLGRSERIVAIKVGESVNFDKFTIHLRSIDYHPQSTYMAETATCVVHKHESSDQHKYVLHPEKRFYPSYEALVSKTALLRDGFSILYMSLGGMVPQDRWTIRLYYHTYILWIWIGAAIMAVGGLLSWRQYKDD